MNKTFLTLPLAILAVTGISSCSTFTPGADSFLSLDYSEVPVDSTTYLVTFTGRADTPRETVNSFLLYHSAELSLQKGYDHFLFMDNWRGGGMRMIRLFQGEGPIANSYDAKAVVTTMAPQIKA